MIRLFRVSIPASVLTLVICDTLLLFGFYLIGAYLGFGEDVEFYLLDDAGLLRIAFVVAVVQIGLYFLDSYEETRTRGQIVLITQQMCIAIGGAFLIQAMLGYGRASLQLHKWAMVDGSVIALIGMPLWRKAFALFVRHAMPAEKVLFLGSSSVMKQIADRLLERPEMNLALVGYLDDVSEKEFPAPRLGGLTELKTTIGQIKPGRLVVGKFQEQERLPMEQLLELRYAGIHIEEAATMFEMVMGRISTDDLELGQLIFSSELGPRPSNVFIQSIYSVLLGVIGIVISLPIMAVVAVLVKVTSPGPILYRQTRVGFRGVPFQVFKFRSMSANAEAGTGAVWAAKADPRITPVGKWLRKLRLDELPQFFNVVRGEMAVAGPRPERPEFCKILEEQIPFYAQRHSVKPGITGWAQINHDYTDTIEDSVTKLEYDLYYIKHLAPSLDAYILFHTLKVMLLSRGSR